MLKLVPIYTYRFLLYLIITADCHSQPERVGEQAAGRGVPVRPHPRRVRRLPRQRTQGHQEPSGRTKVNFM